MVAIRDRIRILRGPLVRTDNKVSARPIPAAVVFCLSERLKCCFSPYRPAAPEGICGSPVFRRSPLLGRSQAVRQRILIPPFGGSIPPAPASIQAVEFVG